MFLGGTHMKKLTAVILSLALALGACAAGFAEGQADFPGALGSLFGLLVGTAEKDGAADEAVTEQGSLFEKLGISPTDDETLNELLYDLLLAEMTDDDNYDDFETAAEIAAAVAGGGTSIDDIVTMLRVLAVSSTTCGRLFAKSPLVHSG